MPETLPIPDFFDSERVGQLYRVPYETRAAEARAWARRHGLKPAAGDAPRVGLLLVDCQNTFCLPGGELFVAGRSGLGAVKDSWRLCQFLYGHLDRISEIILTLDTHTAIQVFHAHFFLDQDGNPPAAYTQITSGDLETGRYRVNPDAAAAAGLGEQALSRHALHYCRRLESQESTCSSSGPTTPCSGAPGTRWCRPSRKRCSSTRSRGRPSPIRAQGTESADRELLGAAARSPRRR